MMRSISLAVLVAGAVLACSPPSSAVPRDMRNPNVITRADIEKSNVFNVYDAVSQLRPAFLNFRGSTTISGSDTGYPRVYLNHQFYGDLQSLRALDVHGVSEIHYYNGTEASTRFGLGNVSGVIEVITDAN
ncbi:MAG: hypothetical protein ABI408_07440 [Gemmatimonadaceae bacterium]